MNDTQCRLCRVMLDTDSPYSIYARNPETFRYTWMHTDCYSVAYQSLQNKAARLGLTHLHRQDEYNDKVTHG